jgi:FkbM family methyltransferase
MRGLANPDEGILERSSRSRDWCDRQVTRGTAIDVAEAPRSNKIQEPTALSGRARVRLALARPVIAYLATSPLPRGKGLLTRRLLRPLLPAAPVSFDLVRPGGSRVRVRYTEVIGISALITGGFEDAECKLMLELAPPGSWAIDVGANVGVHAIPLAMRVRPGRVIGVEALHGNVERLRANAQLNDLDNIDIHEVAAGAHSGFVGLNLANDPAYGSTDNVAEHRGTGLVAQVRQTTLDDLWKNAGCPRMSVLKIDVEGSEVDVIRGAEHLLSAQRPAILAEANTPVARSRLEEALSPFGYMRSPAAVLPWNHLFVVPERQSRE